MDHGTASGSADGKTGRQAANRHGRQAGTSGNGGRLDSGGGVCSKFFEPRIRGKEVRIRET
jgi:hypothetical protein